MTGIGVMGSTYRTVGGSLRKFPWFLPLVTKTTLGGFIRCFLMFTLLECATSCENWLNAIGLLVGLLMDLLMGFLMGLLMGVLTGLLTGFLIDVVMGCFGSFLIDRLQMEIWAAEAHRDAQRWAFHKKPR